MTGKYYDDDSHMTSCEAVVVSCVERADGLFEVETDGTVFFPEAGGQSADRGWMVFADGTRSSVQDVQIDDEGRIVHICDAAAAVGAKVTLSIDWIRRHTFMQHHTGEHLFSGLVHRDFGYANVGFHLSDHICTMDYDGPLSPEQIAAIEAECNEWIYRNVPVRCAYPGEDALRGMDYRYKGELVPPIRIVTIEGADVCACCAPHVKRTGEIGLLRVVSAVSWKGGVRLTILCGRSAVSDYLEACAMRTELSHRFSVPYEEILLRTDALFAERDELRQRVAALAADKLAAQIEQADEKATDVLLFVEELHPGTVRGGVNRLMEAHDGLCGIFSGEDGNFRFTLGSTTIDLSAYADLLRRELSAKCGGSPRMITGTVAAGEAEIRSVLKRET